MGKSIMEGASVATQYVWFEQRIAELEAALAQKDAEIANMQSAFNAAINFALEHDDFDFLRLWDEGDFDALRNEWGDAPEEIYLAQIPLTPPTTEESGDDEQCPHGLVGMCAECICGDAAGVSDGMCP